MNKKQAAAFVVISLTGGSLWIARQMATSPEDQLQISALAYLLCALPLFAIAFLLRLPRPKLKDTGANLILGVTLIAFPYLLTQWAVSRVSPGIAAIVPAATPLVLTFLCDTSWRAKNAAIAGLAGVILMVADVVSVYAGQWTGVVALLAAVAATAGSLVFAKNRLAHIHPVFSVALQLTFAAAILEAVVLGTGKPVAPQPLHLFWIPIAGISVGSCLVYPLYFWLLQRVRPDQLASVVWAQLAASIAEGIIFVHPRISLRMAAGAIVIGGALVLMAQSEAENKLLTVGVTPRPR